MPKKRRFSLVRILIIIVITLLISYSIYSNYHNKKAGEQRLTIKYCNQDEDCVMKDFNSYDCGGSWSGCFNKGEEPRDDILFKLQPRAGLHCDPNFNCKDPQTCICEEGRCIPNC